MPDAQEVSVPDNEPFALVLKNAKRRIKDELLARETISNAALDRIFARISAAYDRDNAQAAAEIDDYKRILEFARNTIHAGDEECEESNDLLRNLCDEVEQMEEADTVLLTDRARRIESIIEKARELLGAAPRYAPCAPAPSVVSSSTNRENP